MTAKFRLAIAGTGLISRESHLPAALATPNVAVTALVEPVVDRAQALARDYGIEPVIATSLTEVLKDVDGVVIATPNHTHRDLAIACAEHGVAALIEKPLALDAQEAADIAQAAERHGTLIGVGYVTRFRPNVQMLHDLLSEGYFGTVRGFVHQFGTSGGWAPLSGYNLTAASSGGGVVMVTATHFIDRMLAFWGYPSESSYWDDACGGPEANAVCRFHFDLPQGPIVGTGRYSKTTSLPGGTVIDTERGLIVMEDFDDSEIVLKPADLPGKSLVIRSDAAPVEVDPFQRQLQAFVQAARGTGEYPIQASHGLESLRLIDQLYAQRQPLYTSWFVDS